jgi:hypothetical protein
MNVGSGEYAMDWVAAAAKGAAKVVLGKVVEDHFQRALRSRVESTGELLFIGSAHARVVGDWYIKYGYAALTQTTLFIDVRPKQNGKTIKVNIPLDALSFQCHSGKLWLQGMFYWFTFTHLRTSYELGVPNAGEFINTVGPGKFPNLADFPDLTKALAASQSRDPADGRVGLD